jgi:hypothetical protein
MPFSKDTFIPDERAKEFIEIAAKETGLFPRQVLTALRAYQDMMRGQIPSNHRLVHKGVFSSDLHKYGRKKSMYLEACEWFSSINNRPYFAK